jgi:hypothetical protein
LFVTQIDLPSPFNEGSYSNLLESLLKHKDRCDVILVLEESNPAFITFSPDMPGS